jgi:hypothetical protein
VNGPRNELEPIKPLHALHVVAVRPESVEKVVGASGDVGITQKKLGGIDFRYPAQRVTPAEGEPLRRQLADPRVPVSERRSCAGAMAGSAARTEQVVASAAEEERTAPVGVVAGVSLGEFAGDPDRVAVHCSSAEVAPARADRKREPLLLVARETVVTRSSTRRDDVRVADTD